VYVFECELCEPFWLIEERTRTKKGCAGEWTSPRSHFQPNPPHRTTRASSSDRFDQLHAGTPRGIDEKLGLQYRTDRPFRYLPAIGQYLRGPLGLAKHPPGAIGGCQKTGGRSYDQTPTHCMCIRKAKSPAGARHSSQRRSCSDWRVRSGRNPGGGRRPSAGRDSSGGRLRLHGVHGPSAAGRRGWRPLTV